jgi:D-alanine-D-alanine ligase
MAKKTVAIVCGGYSKEEEISLKSAEQIFEIIDKSLFDVYTVLINSKGWFVKSQNGNLPINKNDFSFSESEKKITFDVVFMAIHGTPGEDGKLQSYFEMLNIPVTTGDSFVSSLTFNKYAVKTYLKDAGILTAKAALVRKGVNYSEQDIVDKLGLPVFVKPNSGGSSFGVTKVKSIEQLKPAVDKAFAEDNEVIIEEFIKGREFTAGIFISDNENFILPVTEIISKTEFFDYEAKYKGLSDEVTPANLPQKLRDKCQQLTYEIYKILNCRGVVRVDYLSKNNFFYFIEVNTVPGMSKESIIPQQIKIYGAGLSDFYTKLIYDAIEKQTK